MKTPSKQPRLLHEDVIKCIEMAKLPDEAVIDAGLAALYLGISTNTLARHRQQGDGPPYIQYPATGSTARNQKIVYLISDLRNWRRQYRVVSTLNAAVNRGLAFKRINDLLYPQPFWVKGKVLLSHALEIDSETFINQIQSSEYQVIWLNWLKVFSTTWEVTATMLTYREKYIGLLTKLLNNAQ